MPRRCVILPALPLSDGGKVDRRAIAEMIEPVRAPDPTLDGGEDPVLDVLRRALAHPAFGEHDDFFAAGGNSLHALSAVTALRRSLGVPLDIRDLMRNPTAADLRGLAARRCGGSDLLPDQRALVDADIAAALMPAPPPWVPAEGPPRSVLLTGATGFVGTHLLHELLSRTEARVVCLVRGDDGDQARARLVEAARGYGLWRPEHDARVEVVAGDLAMPRLGLDPARWDALAAEIELVLHNGALVNLFYDYRVHREANVLGTAEMLRLARHGGVPLHHVSTLGALHTHALRHGGPVPEDVDIATIDAPPGGYSCSKWAAERLLAAAAAQGGPPITVLRLGEVMPSTSTGAPNRLALTHLLITAMHRRGAAPRAALRSDYSPADRVAATVVAAVLDRTVWGRALHLFSPGGVAVESLLDGLTPVGCARFVADLRAADDETSALLSGMLPGDLDGEAAARHALEGLLQDNPALFDRSECAALEQRAGLEQTTTEFAAYRRFLNAGDRALAGA